MKHWSGLLLWLAVLSPAAAEPPVDWTLEQLMQSLAAVGTVEAGFRERKELALLQQPLELTGTLRYRAPAYLLKQVLQPYPERYEVDEDWLTVDTPEQGLRHLPLDGYPLLRAFVESVRATLAGDLQTLQRYYRVQFHGQPEGWNLRLEPVTPAMSQFVTAIVIQGQAAQVLSVETLESDGDRSLMTIAPQAMAK